MTLPEAPDGDGALVVVDGLGCGADGAGAGVPGAVGGAGAGAPGVPGVVVGALCCASAIDAVSASTHEQRARRVIIKISSDGAGINTPTRRKRWGSDLTLVMRPFMLADL